MLTHKKSLYRLSKKKKNVNKKDILQKIIKQKAIKCHTKNISQLEEKIETS